MAHLSRKFFARKIGVIALSLARFWHQMQGLWYPKTRSHWNTLTWATFVYIQNSYPCDSPFVIPNDECSDSLGDIYIQLHTYIYNYIQTYIYTYIYIYTYVCMSIYVYIYTHIYIYIYTYIHTYIYIYTPIYSYIYIQLYTYLYIYIYYVHVHSHIEYIYIYIHVLMCIPTNISVYIDIYTHTHIYVYIHIYSFMIIHIHICRYMSVHWCFSHCDSEHIHRCASQSAATMLYTFIWLSEFSVYPYITYTIELYIYVSYYVYCRTSLGISHRLGKPVTEVLPVRQFASRSMPRLGHNLEASWRKS